MREVASKAAADKSAAGLLKIMDDIAAIVEARRMGQSTQGVRA